MKKGFALVLATMATVIFLSPQSFAQGAAAGSGNAYVQKVQQTLTTIADEQDKNPSANWFPSGKRDFNTAYRSCPNREKAVFADP